MIVDRLEHLKNYKSLHPDMPAVIDFLLTHDLNAMPEGKTDIGHGFINVQTINPKSKTDARLESHIEMIDIQIPLTGDEVMGYQPVEETKPGEYNAAKDITFHPGEADTYIKVKKGMFAIFFPQDVHAPGITSLQMRKVVIKLPVR